MPPLWSAAACCRFGVGGVPAAQQAVSPPYPATPKRWQATALQSGSKLPHSKGRRYEFPSNGAPAVSREPSTAPSDTAAIAMMYNAGDRSSWLRAIRYVATMGVVPPKMAWPTLYETDIALQRTAAGNASAIAAGSGPTKMPSSTAKPI